MPHTPGSDAGELHDPLIADPVELDQAANQSMIDEALYAEDQQRKKLQREIGSQ